ncbi:SET domain-containing protein-lysine N-methyltransferase [Candidatus Pelagibacter sp.]|uniref:SET domain-containing protein-lysine N-methyltransferase n=1 Tax=Candidatus Pelagibacter sp. TaxID=2024849 RepID=UPI003F83283A
MYRPLPKSLTIKDSKIDGLGLFSKTKIQKNTFIGITHVKHDDFQDMYIRTPLGGFYNHSKNPNVTKISSDTLPKYYFGQNIEMKIKESLEDKNNNKLKYFYLVSLKDIEPGEEILAKYTFYEF